MFGSEVNAILQHPAVHRELDEDAFYDYLTFAFAPPPRTLFKGIHKLAPAECMVVQADGQVRASALLVTVVGRRRHVACAAWARRRW